MKTYQPTKDEQIYLDKINMQIKHYDARIKDAKDNAVTTRELASYAEGLAETNEENIEKYTEEVDDIIQKHNQWRVKKGLRELKFRGKRMVVHVGYHATKKLKK